MLDKLKLNLAGWSFKTFGGKYLRRGIRVAVGFVAAWASGQGVDISPEAQAVVGGVVWSLAEAGANLAKVKAERSDKFRWVGRFL